MPILGMNVSDQLISKTRTGLLSRLLGSSMLREVVGGALKLTRQPYTGDYILTRWTAINGFEQVAKFGILPLPGCKGVCVFHHAEVFFPWRHKGIGRELLKIRHGAAYEAGYTRAVATVELSNITEIDILEDANWKAEWSFVNRRTGHSVMFYSREL